MVKTTQARGAKKTQKKETRLNKLEHLVKKATAKRESFMDLNDIKNKQRRNDLV